MTTALEGGEGSSSRPGRSLPPGKTRYPLYRRLGGGPKAGLDRCEKSRPPPGFNPRIVQPVASRCTDYATRPTLLGIRVYLKSVLRYKFLILDIHHPDTRWLREQGCENPWLFSETKRGPRAKKLGKHCCIGNYCKLERDAFIGAHC